MKCVYFSECGGCSLPLDYQTQLEKKIQKIHTLGFQPNEVYSSPKDGFRARAEFRIYRDEEGLHYAMSAEKKPLPIHSCPILLPYLQEVLHSLLSILNRSKILQEKLFGVEVLGTLQNDALIVLLYHKFLDESWGSEAKELEHKLGISIIGRSRGQKKILSTDSLQDSFEIDGETYYFTRYDNAFSQPNPFINLKMLDFTLSCIKENAREDLLELYCGGGNFTIPLSKYFKKVFATEIAKSSIQALKQNLKKNQISNIFCARLSGEESIQALRKEREFFRLKGINLEEYRFSHIFIDPPRSGVGDEKMLRFIASFPNILYISCNPITLHQDLQILMHTHKIKRFALFDQFPYTHHLECGVWLEQI